MDLLTPAGTNENQLAADSNIKLVLLLYYTCSMNKNLTQGHVHMYFALAATFVMCIYFSLRRVCMCQCTSDFGMWCLMFTSSALNLLLVGHMSSISALQCFKVSSLQLTQKIVRVPPSPQPCCGSPTQRSMCYSSHVVRSCQKQPWQILLFCLWNDHVGLTLQTTMIIRSWLSWTRKISFVGTLRHNSKAGGRFICKVNEIQHYSLLASKVKKAEKIAGTTLV